VWRCGFIPKALGLLLIAAGFAYLIGSFTSLITPQWAQGMATWVFVLEMGEPMIILRLLVSGAMEGR